MIELAIGGLVIRVAAAGDGGTAVEAALAQRCAGFIGTGRASDVILHVEASRGFSADYHLDEPEQSLRISTARAGERIAIEGGARGWFDVERGVGVLDRARHLGEVDALIRLALSLSLPSRDALLLHASAVPTGAGRDSVTVLVGASGAGKSTAAAELGGGLSDELVVLHATPSAVEASGTPYWRGRPARRRVDTLVHLRRGGPGSRRWLRGSAALRAIAPHVVRYIADAEVDRACFDLLGRACASVPVAELSCPEGAAFVPFLRRALVDRSDVNGGAEPQ
jgi:hypothetical protein